jgi:hypothetical protein
MNHGCPAELSMLPTNKAVMPGLDPGIHVELHDKAEAWMAGSSPAMTREESVYRPNRTAERTVKA